MTMPENDPLSSQESSGSMPIMMMFLGIMFLVIVLLGILVLKYATEENNWKRRWHDESKALSEEVKALAQKVADETNAKVVEQNRVSALEAKLAEVEDHLNHATTSLQQREEDLAKLTRECNRHKTMSAILKERHPEIYEELVDIPPGQTHLIQADIAAIRENSNGEQDVVMLTLGKGAKVEEGDEFIVFRGNQYIVKVRVEKMLNDMAACRVVSESWNTKNLKIQTGDKAQSRF
jgi:hypothetical protein